MSDLNWCTYCDSAINSFSDSLYCSEACLRQDALNHHPLLGYNWAGLKDFPRSAIPVTPPHLSPPILYQRCMSPPVRDTSSISSSFSFTPPATPPPRISHSPHSPSTSVNKKIHNNPTLPHKKALVFI